MPGNFVGKPPSNTTAYVLGGATTVAAIMWGSAVGVAGLVHTGDVPLALYMLIIAAASTSTLVALLVGVGHLQRRAAVRDASALLDGVSTLTACVRQLTANVERIDPIKIYADAVEDLLTDAKPR